MNPFNGSFSFLVDQLPPNTPLRVNIYARNTRKRSPIQVELDAKTLRAAERRADSYSHSEGHPRGRKSSFFEELYGGYGRFRSKHLVVGLLVGTVAVAVIIAVILVVIATLRTRRARFEQSATSHSTNDDALMLRDKCGSGGSSGPTPNERRKSRSEIKETPFGEEMKAPAPPPAVAIVNEEYAPYDDDTSTRSDHQLIQNKLAAAAAAAVGGHEHQTFYHSLMKRAPPNYFDLDPSGSSSIGSGDAATLTNDSEPSFVIRNQLNSVEPKPDIIQTLYQRDNQRGHPKPASSTGEESIFDTISFGTINGSGTHTNTTATSNAYGLHEINSLDPLSSGTMLLTSDQISGE